MLTHIRPSRRWFACQFSSLIKVRRVPALCLGPCRNRQVPRAPLPASGVTSGGATSRVSSEGVTLPSSLLRTHASGQVPLTDFGLPYSVSLCRLPSAPAGKLALPDVIFTICAKALGPVPRRVPTDLFVCAPPPGASALRSQDTGLSLG